MFQRGQFVVMTAGGDWKGRRACVLSIAPRSEWRYLVAVEPAAGEKMVMTVKVRENQLKDYAP